MAKAKELGSYHGHDIELCRTTNDQIGARTAALLIEERIPFTKNCKKIPFFRRDKYKGASKVWVISINPYSYHHARRVLDMLEPPVRKGLVLSNY